MTLSADQNFRFWVFHTQMGINFLLFSAIMRYKLLHKVIPWQWHWNWCSTASHSKFGTVFFSHCTTIFRFVSHFSRRQWRTTKKKRLKRKKKSFCKYESNSRAYYYSYYIKYRTTTAVATTATIHFKENHTLDFLFEVVFGRKKLLKSISFVMITFKCFRNFIHDMIENKDVLFIGWTGWCVCVCIFYSLSETHFWRSKYCQLVFVVTAKA